MVRRLGHVPHKGDERCARSTALRRNPACLTQAPYCASPTLCLRHYFPANLVVQLELLCLFPTTKNWPDRNVSTSERTHGTALGRVRAGQCPVPLAAAEATQRRHKERYRKLPWPLWAAGRPCLLTNSLRASLREFQLVKKGFDKLVDGEASAPATATLTRFC